MAIKKKPKTPDKEIRKVLTGETKVKPTKKIRRYVAERNIKEKLAIGWKVIDQKHASDLVLMEK